MQTHSEARAEFLFMSAKSRKSKSVDESILNTFTLELNNRSDARWEELVDRINEAVIAKEREADESAKTNPKARLVVDQVDNQVDIRYPSYRKHLDQIGQDFLAVFDSIIKSHCGFISDELNSALIKLFLDGYSSAIARVRDDLHRLLAVLGRKEHFVSYCDPFEGFYTSARSTHYKLLQAEIAKHNLGYSAMKIKRHAEIVKEHEVSSSGLKRFRHGELKKRLERLLERDRCGKHQTVQSTKIAKWIREITAENYYTSESIIRAKLSKMGYSTESPF